MILSDGRGSQFTTVDHHSPSTLTDHHSTGLNPTDHSLESLDPQHNGTCGVADPLLAHLQEDTDSTAPPGSNMVGPDKCLRNAGE